MDRAVQLTLWQAMHRFSEASSNLNVRKEGITKISIMNISFIRVCFFRVRLMYCWHVSFSESHIFQLHEFSSDYISAA